MVHHLKGPSFVAVIVLSLALVACGSDRPVRTAGPRIALPRTDEQVPVIGEPQFGGGGATTSLGGEKLGEVAAATPEGLRITTIEISPLSQKARDALRFTGLQNGNGPGLITLPIYGVNPQIGMYYLVVPVVNDGPEPVRNLKARAEFLDADDNVVWVEEEPITHLPTRLGLNPPSLPNDPSTSGGELGSNTKNFNLYYFHGNVGLFTFAVPDTAVAKTVASWRLIFLVSTT
jgi:hypothetical protein